MKGLASLIFRLTDQNQNAVARRFKQPAEADFRLSNGDPESEVVGSVLVDHDIHLVVRIRC